MITTNGLSPATDVLAGPSSPPSAATARRRASAPVSLEAFIAAVASALGADAVDASEAALLRHQRSTLPAAGAPRVVLRPADTLAVSTCVTLAKAHGVRWHPISTGKNWGYGSATVPDGVLAVLDLSRLNRIRRFDPVLGLVWVEPGVTQGDLHHYLAGHPQGGDWWMDATGSAIDTSLVGNTSQRGFGHTPYGARVDHVNGMEVVLRDGTVMDTSFGGNPQAQAAGAFRWGLGPQVDGLFHQSDLGVITCMAIELMPRPARTLAFIARIDDAARLPAFVEALATLRRDDTLRGCVHLGNAWKAVAAVQRFPFEQHDLGQPLSRGWMEDQRRRLGFGAWSATGALYGPADRVKADRARVRAALKAAGAHVAFVSVERVRSLSRWVNRLPRGLRQRLEPRVKLATTLTDLLTGVPNDGSLASAYWRWRGDLPVDLDPDRDGCGLIWWAPVMRAEGAVMTEHSQGIARLMRQGGFEPMLSATLLTGRAVCLVASILYDRRDAVQTQRAAKLLRALEGYGHRHGLLPYRPRVGQPIEAQDDGMRAFLATLRGALDDSPAV